MNHCKGICSQSREAFNANANLAGLKIQTYCFRKAFQEKSELFAKVGKGVDPKVQIFLINFYGVQRSQICIKRIKRAVKSAKILKLSFKIFQKLLFTFEGGQRVLADSEKVEIFSFILYLEGLH